MWPRRSWLPAGPGRGGGWLAHMLYVKKTSSSLAAFTTSLPRPFFSLLFLDGGLTQGQHYVHDEPPQSSHFHIIIDMDYAQITDPHLGWQLPHEMYRVSFNEG